MDEPVIMGKEKNTRKNDRKLYSRHQKNKDM